MAAERDYRNTIQQQDTNEEELASRTLHIQSKRFYLDVKENRRGRFLKIAEVSSGGRKTRLIMSMNVAKEFHNQIQTFLEYLRTLTDEKQFLDNDQLRSTVISRDDRKYYLDLKENDRGRFLRISMIGINNPRTQIAIPAQGLEEFKEILGNLIQEFGTEDDQDSIESLPAKEPNQLPESRYVRVGNKIFYFDVGSNDRGIFLRISEVRPNFRTVITIPEKTWPHFRDNLHDLILFMDSKRRQ